jgi:hypothetical protein
LPDGTCTGGTITVEANGDINQSVDAMDAFAIHIAARTDWDYGSLAPSYGLVYHTTNAPRLGSVWRSDDGVLQGNWTTTNGKVGLTVNGAAGFVSGWVDWNHDGDFTDANELVFTNESFTSGESRELTFTTPFNASNQTFNFRFRVYDTAQTMAPPSPTGGAGAGEVEDHTFTFGVLAVTLADFGAEPQSEAVRVYWTTATEIQTLGFNLYRADTEDFATAIRINDELIPAQGTGGSQGASYELLDGDVTVGNDYYYWLEDMDTAGQTTLHGPVSTNATTPTAIDLATLGTERGTSLPLQLAIAGLVLVGVVGIVLRFPALKRRG